MKVFILILLACISLHSASVRIPEVGHDDVPRVNAPTTFWYSQIKHNGISPFINNGSAWQVFRNVKDFGAVGDGVTDDAGAIQRAINFGNPDGDRSQNAFGTTGQPAVVYFPAGTYVLASPIQIYLDTVIMGDPIYMPTLKASSGFGGNTLVYGKDPHKDSTLNFYITIKNLVLDSNNIPGSTKFTLLDWSVSQATQLTNVVINMPNYSTGHTGITMPEGGSGTYLGDLVINGGVVGIDMSNQQYMVKNVLFNGSTTGIRVSHCFDCVFQGCTFTNVATGIDMTPGGMNNIGSVVVVDSVGMNLGTFINTHNSGTGDRSLILENVKNSGTTVMVDGNAVLSGSVTDTWYMGNEYLPGGSPSGQHTSGTSSSTPRPAVLLDSNGNYFVMAPPTYKEYDLDQFINIKTVPNLPVHGDGTTDDTANINSILSQNAGNKIIFFPAGTYLVSNTIFVPGGSRIMGEVWSAISAVGDYFNNPSSPKPMVKVGNPGDKGVAQISDILLTVADVLPGCLLLEVNMAGNSPGDVGFWNVHFRVGGASGTRVQTRCGGSASNCKAAFGLVHLTKTSSAYIEDMWGWTADHDLDGGNHQTISTGRGCLVESTQGTWLVGTAFEHNTLYQYNINNAQNVYAGMQQCETPYWQGPGNVLTPDPWTPLSEYGDPTFSNCAGGDGRCRMAWYEVISGSSNIFLYGGGFWTFFNNGGGCNTCQTNAVEIQDTTKLWIYGLNTRALVNMIANSGDLTVPQNNNPGGWGGIVAAMLARTG